MTDREKQLELEAQRAIEGLEVAQKLYVVTVIVSLLTGAALAAILRRR